MAQLTKSQKDFLHHYGIREDETFDASGMSKSEYSAQMRGLGAKIAYGTTPCNAYGHSLRTRAGHCAQCDPRRIVFLNRHDSFGWQECSN